jgi:hypothetical protein
MIEYWKHFLLPKLTATCWRIAMSSPPKPFLQQLIIFTLWRFKTRNNGHLEDLDLNCSSHCRNRHPRFRLPQQSIINNSGEDWSWYFHADKDLPYVQKYSPKENQQKGAARSQIEVSAKFVHATASVLLKRQDGYRGWGIVCQFRASDETKRECNEGKRPPAIKFVCVVFYVWGWELGKWVVEGMVSFGV